LVQEVPVHIDTVWLGKVLGDQLSDDGEVLLFLGGFILYVLELEVCG
jgi:hypothetical protein